MFYGYAAARDTHIRQRDGIGELLMIDILWAVFKYCLLIVIVGIIIAITVAALCAIAAMIKLAIGAVISFFREV